MTAEVKKGEDSAKVYRYGGDTGREWGDNFPWYIRWATGVVLTVNFLMFWAVPIFGQGQAWKKLLRRFFRPIYQWIDSNKTVRAFASKFIYTRPIHADFFVNAVMILIAWGLPFLYVLNQQITYGTLSWKQIYFYYIAWVGFGGRVMGGAYTFAHKEGHNGSLYKPWFYNVFGNLFENVIGSFFGNVPYNFTTSHIYLHHRLNAGTQDTFYQWDLDRTSWVDFMVFMHRIILHTSGFSSLVYFKNNNFPREYGQLAWGMVIYYLIVPTALLAMTSGSLSFFFFIYLQPMICMTFFLAFMNFAFHAFIDYDENGKAIECVNSTAIIEGDDDYFGEDDHMAHHYATHVYWRDLPKYRTTQVDAFKKHNAAVFRDISIVELAAMLLFKDWKGLAQHYVQFNEGSQSHDQASVKDTHADGSANIAKGSRNGGKRTEAESKALIAQGAEDLTETFRMSVWNYTGRLNEEEIIAMLKSRATRREPLKTQYVHKL